MFVARKSVSLTYIIAAVLCLLGISLAWLAARASASPMSQAKEKVAQGMPGGRPLSNRITEENALPGTDEWANIGNYDINALSAFPGSVSVNAGQPINIHVKSSGNALSARLYRLGYYQDHGARLYATYNGILTPAQPACTRVSATGLVRCPWSSTFTINTDPNWISGIYLLRMDSNNGFRFFVYFTVRNDGYNAPILVMEPSKTNQAYNRYGKESLYYSGNNEGRTRAYQVSFDRPYEGGAGTGGLFTHDIEMVRWLEASGYDVTYITDVDRAANPSILLNHDLYLVMGHDEYWTWGERDAVEIAVASGVNVIFASGNESYWNIRMEDSPLGPNRIITCYKDAALDPAPTGPDETITFRDLGRPENMLIGTGYQSYHDDAIYNGPWVVNAPADRWYFDCTGLQPGDRVNNIVGEEWNALLYNGGTPPGIELISNGTVIGNNGLPYAQQSTIYTAPGGAKVFAAGSIHWSWGLIDHSYANQVFQPYALSNDADHRIEQMTANIIDHFAGYWDGQPRPCGPPYSFYSVGSRPTRTPKPQPPTATGTPPTATRTRTATPTPIGSSTATGTRTSTPTRSVTSTISPTPPVPTATASTGCAVTYISTDVPRSITDQGTITSTLAVNGAGTISDIAVTGLTIEHAYASDLRVFLISPQGTRVELFTHVCGSGIWTASNTGFSISTSGGSVMGATCPPGQGTYLPEVGSLSPLLGQSAQGIWRLEITDAGPSDVGTLLAWKLYIAYSAAGCATGTATAVPPSATATGTPTSTPVPASPTATRTWTPLPTGTPTSTPVVPTSTNIAISTATGTWTPLPTGTPTSTSVVVPTSTNTPVSPTPTRTWTPLPTGTPTSTSVVPVPTSTNTSISTPTATRTNTTTPAQSPTRTSTPTRTRTATRTSTATRTPTRTRTATRTPSPTRTSTSTRTAVSTSVATFTPTSTPSGGCSFTYVSTNVPRAIPDQGIITSTLAISDSGTIASIVVTGLTIEHTYASDLSVYLVSPQGLRVALLTHICGSSVWTSSNTGFAISAAGTGVMGTTCPPGQGTYLPEEGSLSPLVGQPSYGIWRLEVADGGPYDVGTLRAWKLWIAYSNMPCPVGTPIAIAPQLPPTPEPAPCTVGFADVPPGSSFYEHTRWMACRGYISGYACGSVGEPCGGSYFRPGASVTRGQMMKMVVNAAGWLYSNPEKSSYADVTADSPFALFIETGADRGIIGGYPCGGPGEPCDERDRPYFRPNNNITRGQLSKVLALARSYMLPVRSTPTFADVASTDPFYRYIEALSEEGIIGGYTCGGPGEPCDQQGRPYFRPTNTATRGQLSKFITIGYNGP
jgi:subtilisin-like proprotein convertase family protein